MAVARGSLLWQQLWHSDVRLNAQDTRRGRPSVACRPACLHPLRLSWCFEHFPRRLGLACTDCPPVACARMPATTRVRCHSCRCPHCMPAVLEPHVAVCHEQQLLALANCAAPAPCSVVKVYSTHPAPPSSKPAIKTSSSIRHSGGSTWPAGSAADPSAAAAAAAAAVSVVGDSSCPGAVGALLLKELPVTAAADMRLSQGLLLVASCFHGRAVSNNSPFRWVCKSGWFRAQG